MGSFDSPPDGGDAPGGWWILFEPELHFGQNVLVPDLAGWRRERMPRMPNVTGFTLAPDWVCETISPSTGSIDRGRKMRIYAQEGVAHLWIVGADRTHASSLPARRRALDRREHARRERSRAHRKPFDAVTLDPSDVVARASIPPRSYSA